MGREVAEDITTMQDSRQENMRDQQRTSQLAETRRANDQRDEAQKQAQEERNRHQRVMEKLTGQKNALTGQALAAKMNAPKKITYKMETLMREESSKATSMNSALAAYSPTYASPTGGSIPKSGTLANYVASEAPFFATDDAKARQKWWAEWDRAYTLGERNSLFGATLTSNEQTAWAKANIHENMTDEQIQLNMAEIARLKNLAISRLTQSMSLQGYDQEVIDVYFGDLESMEQGPLNGPPQDPNLDPQQAMLDQLEAEYAQSAAGR